MKKIILLILLNSFVVEAQIYIKPIIDTTQTISVSLLDDTSNQNIICRLRFLNWNEPVYWTQIVLYSPDTLAKFERSFDWCEFVDMEDSCNFVNKDSVLCNIQSWFFKYMQLPKRYIINVGDKRRSDFKQFSKFCFEESYNELGYSEKEIENIYSLFWTRYFDKPIICIEPPIEPVRGGDESLYVYDSFTHKIVRFYRP